MSGSELNPIFHISFNFRVPGMKGQPMIIYNYWILFISGGYYLVLRNPEIDGRGVIFNN